MLVRDDVASGSTKSSKDVLIENFDISYGGNVLMEGCFLRLVYGRKYTLVCVGGGMRRVCVVCVVVSVCVCVRVCVCACVYDILQQTP